MNFFLEYRTVVTVISLLVGGYNHSETPPLINVRCSQDPRVMTAMMIYAFILMIASSLLLAYIGLNNNVYELQRMHLFASKTHI